MALKFLNKKGWHTGNLRNVEKVWTAEQKHEAEQRKLDELRKQIHNEREFHQLQQRAGHVPRQERLDFLYELPAGKGSSRFEELKSLTMTSTSSSSANDAWRKLHSDPLLLIRQKEQQAIARVKNNPVQMATIRKPQKDNIKRKQHEHRTKKSENKRESHHDRHRYSVKLSEEERAARLREMQIDAERHEVQRSKRLKKESENDAREAVLDRPSWGKSFLDDARESVYSAAGGGESASTLKECVRRRTHYLQGKSSSDSNAFRRYN